MNTNSPHPWLPEIFDLQQPPHRKRFQEILDLPGVSQIDALEDAIEDLFRIDYPFVDKNQPEFKKTLTRYRERYLNGNEAEDVGVWVYIPWRNIVVHLPSRSDYHKLQTSRNKHLVTAAEQEQFSNKSIGIAGLSVGSWAVAALALSGASNNLRLADFDSLSITNLNRLYSGIAELATNKAVNMARRVIELNPFANLDVFTDGFNLHTMPDFFAKDGKRLDLFIEEMDDIKLKIEARFKARELGIPLIMATDNGDNAYVDVERFDLDNKAPIFHGKVSEEFLRSIPDKPSAAEKAHLAVKIVGTDITPAMQHSLQMVGSQLPTWPQLATGATLSGIAACYAARRILTGLSMPSGRYEVNLDSLLDPDYASDNAVAYRKAKKDDFVQAFEVMFGKE